MKVKEESEKVALKLNIQQSKIMASGPITSWQIDGETVETVKDFIWVGSKITTDGDCSHEIKRHLLLGRKYEQPRQHIKKQRHYFSNKGPSSQSYGFSSSHIWKLELEYKESWVVKNLCFWTVVVGKILESPLDFKEIKPVNPKGNQSWIFIGTTDVEPETSIIWLHDGKNWLTGKDPNPGKDWRQEEKRLTNEMVGYYRWLNGHKFEWVSGAGDGLWCLACCSPWGLKESWHNWATELNWYI